MTWASLRHRLLRNCHSRRLNGIARVVETEPTLGAPSMDSHLPRPIQPLPLLHSCPADNKSQAPGTARCLEETHQVLGGKLTPLQPFSSFQRASGLFSQEILFPYGFALSAHGAHASTIILSNLASSLQKPLQVLLCSACLLHIPFRLASCIS